MAEKFINGFNLKDKLIFNFLGNFVFAFSIIVAIALMLFSSVTTECLVTNISMQPTFNYPNKDENDIVYINNLDTDYEIGDIIVIDTMIEENAIIKRIIGLPGDIIDIVEYNNIYKLERNGEIIDEDFIYEDTDPTQPTYLKNGMKDCYNDFQDLKSKHPEYFNSENKLVVQKNSIYALGDNRAHSDDSNTFGLFDFSQVEGIVELIKPYEMGNFEFYWNYIMHGKFFYTIINIF